MTDIQQTTLFDYEGQAIAETFLEDITLNEGLSSYVLDMNEEEIKQAYHNILLGIFSEKEIEACKKVMAYQTTEDFETIFKNELIRVGNLHSFLTSDEEEEYEEE